MAVDSSLLVILRSNGIGDTEPDLGARLMRNFLEQLLDSGHLPQKIVFMGTAIFLTTEGSPFVELLQRFASSGCDLASCITCLDYYGRRDKLRVGHEGNMKQTVQAMLAAQKVLSP